MSDITQAPDVSPGEAAAFKARYPAIARTIRFPYTERLPAGNLARHFGLSDAAYAEAKREFPVIIGYVEAHQPTGLEAKGIKRYRRRGHVLSLVDKAGHKIGGENGPVATATGGFFKDPRTQAAVEAFQRAQQEVKRG